MGHGPIKPAAPNPAIATRLRGGHQRRGSASRSVRRFCVPPMIISPLPDVPDIIQTLAKWFYDEWHDFDRRSVEFIANQLSENFNRDSIPITFVGHRNSELLGSVSLELSDLPRFDHLSPWLASLYVHASFRGQGVGRTLVRH